MEGTSRRPIPPEWELGVARLPQQRQPAGVPQRVWRVFIGDCERFFDPRHGWAERAAELGWDARALFGCDPQRPLDHPGAGLLWRLGGGRITSIKKDWATVDVNGVERVFHRRPARPSTALPWELPW